MSLFWSSELDSSPTRVSSSALVTPAPCFQSLHLFPLIPSPAAAASPLRAPWAVMMNGGAAGLESTWLLTVLSLGEFLMSKLPSLMRLPLLTERESGLLGALFCFGWIHKLDGSAHFHVVKQNFGARVYGWAQSVSVWMEVFVKW